MSLICVAWFNLSLALLAQPAQEFNSSDTAVLAALRSGQASDLAHINAPVRAELLEQVLTEQMQNSGLATFTLRHATIAGNLQLHGRPIKRMIMFGECIFLNPIDLSSVTFERDVHFDRCMFNGATDFANITAHGDVSFEGSQFQSLARFDNMNIGGDFILDDTRFFRGPMVGKTVQMRFLRVSRSCFMRNTKLEYPLDMSYAEIQNVLDGNWMRTTDRIILYSMSAGKLILEGGHFYGPFDLKRARVAQDASFQGSHFFDVTDESARFDELATGGGLFFNNAVFHGRADFRSCDVGIDFDLEGVQFLSAVKVAINCDSMVVKRAVYLNGSTLIGDAHFEHVNVGGPVSGIFEARNTFWTTLFFDAMTVNGDVQIINPRVRGVDVDSCMVEAKGGLRVLMNGGACDNLVIDAVDGLHLKDLLLSRTNVRGSCTIRNARIDNIALATARIAHSLHFEDVAVTSHVDLRHSQIGAINLNAVRWPAKPGACLLQGLHYDYFGASDRICDLADAQAFLACAVYSAEPYQKLEDFYNKQGYAEFANTIYIGRRIRERDVLTKVDRIGNWILYALVGYGRHPELALVWSACFILIGAICFRSRSMEWRGRPELLEKSSYSALWYSCDKFLPFVDLGLADIWGPRRGTWIACFAPLFVLIGWILVPLGLASVTGIIR